MPSISRQPTWPLPPRSSSGGAVLPPAASSPPSTRRAANCLCAAAKRDCVTRAPRTAARGCAIFIVEVTLRGIVASSYAGRERLADEAAPLDVLLVDAAADPLRRFTPDALTAKFAVA